MPAPLKEKIIWVAVGALIIFILLGVFLLGKWYGAQTSMSSLNFSADKKISFGNSGEYIVEKKVPTSQTDTKSNYPESQSVAETAGWKTFSNSTQKYKMSYPPSGKIAQLGTSGHEADADSTDGSCVSLKLPNGYVRIAGKNRTEEQEMMCLRTGVGSDWENIADIQIEAFGKKYAASGMGTASASAGYKKEFYYFETETGEKIEFGIEVNEKYAPDVTHDSAKTEVLEVLKTLAHL